MVKDQDIVQAVKDRDSSALKKLLHRAGKSNKKLLGTTRKININFQDEDGMSALHQASLMGNLEMMQLLLESGIQSGLKDHKGMLALHYAAWQGKTEPVHSLLQWKSPVNEQSLDGSTPLHLACQHGHFDVVNLLLLHNAVPTMIKKDNKTPLDLACEFGRYRVVDLLLRSNMCAPLLLDSPSDMYNNDRTTPIHLAAKNGHIEIIRLLLQAGVNINRSTLRGTCLHEAALCGKIEVVRLLLDCGVDVNKANSYDQTALDIVTSYTTSRAAKDLKHLLKEASFAVQARAIKNYCNIYDPNTISFKEGDIIKVIEQREDAWKGVVISDGRMAKPGFFPPDHVVLIDNSSHLPNHIVQGKRVHMPNVPDLLNRSPGYHQHVGPGMDYPFPPPPPSLYSPKSAGREHYCGDQSAFPYPPSPYQSCSYSTENINGRIVNHVGEQVGEWSALSPCPGVNDMRNSSPVKGSPTNSNRNSAASSDSGRGYSTGHLEQNSQKPPHNYANVQINNQHRLSSQSYESGVSSRQSYHSNSSSSLGSLDRLEESGHLSQINVAELFNTGLPDHEVLRAWLRDLHFEDYYGLFLHAGYDMPTISHMTPQDLSAIGITKPGHRKRLKAEIVRLNIHDGIPDYKPNDLMEWLHLLGLEQYYSTLMQQGYDNIDFVTDITWEDLEEIGIQKLGHQKKIMLAIDRLKRIMSGCKRLSTMDTKRRSAEDMDHVTMANQRWSGEEYNQEMPSSPFKHKKSSSGDSLNTNGSGDHRYSQHSDRHSQHSERHSHHSDRHSQHSDSSLEFTSHSAGSHASYQPDVVAIQVKRQSSQSGSPKDMAGQPITYQSFQVPPSPRDKEERESTPTGDDLNMSCSPVHVAPMVPKAVIKPKPVAKIIAKTKRSSREDSPDIIDIEKHEIERNQDKGQNNNSTFFPGGSLKKKSLSHSDHIYDQPHLQNSPKSPTEFNVPNVSMSQSLPSGPVNPIFISTQQQGAPQQQQSPKSRKVPPPPPPKRTNSISSRQDVNSSQFAGSIPKSALQHTYTNIQKTPTQSHVSSVTAQKVTPNTKNGNTPKNVQNQSQIDQTIAPKQQAFATCVQSLSERFGSKRAEVAGEDNLSSDGEDFPPPPPPIAMDIITPKIHNYGIPSKNDKDGSDYRIKAKMDNTGKVDSDGSSVEGTFGVKLRKTDACESVKTNNMSQSVPVKSSSASVSHNNSVVSIGNVPCTTAETTNSQNSHNNGAAKDSSVTVVTNGNQMVKRKDSTNSFDSTVSSSSVESNTLPFANENVGTIKQRTPTTKPSIVPINEGSSGCNNQESQNVGDNSGNFKANVPLNHVTGQQRAPKIGPKPVIAQKPGASPPVQNKKHNDNVLSDIDNMLQGLTEELDAMLEEELAVTAE